MSAQLTLDGAGMCAPTSVTRVEGESLAFVLNGIPTVGHRKGTARENLLRPVAELYRRDLDDPDPTWQRLQTARPALEFPRADFRRVAKTHGDAKWWLTLLRPDFAEVEDFAERIEPGLVACGATVQRQLRWRDRERMTGALLSSIDALVIAMCWSPATAAGCFLASAVEPLSFEWRVRIDDALSHGLPWANRLAELSALHGPLVRAWRWLWETRPRWDACGVCKMYGPMSCDGDALCVAGRRWIDRQYWHGTATT